jgi:hypothetical protein
MDVEFGPVVGETSLRKRGEIDGAFGPPPTSLPGERYLGSNTLSIT